MNELEPLADFRVFDGDWILYDNIWNVPSASKKTSITWSELQKIK